jgi:hypothetical protein
MHVGKPTNKSSQEYSMTDTNGLKHILETTTVERDLGILVSDDLKVKQQVEAAAARANNMLGRLKKSFRSRGLLLWKTLYTTYVRPHLEFAITAWSPHLKQDIFKLEQVQHRVTKLITEIKNEPYEYRLTSLGITTLKDRRTRGDLIQNYRIINGFDEVSFLHEQKLAPSLAVYNLRGHNQRLERQIVSNCEERAQFFTNRVVNPWNALAPSATRAESVNAFKDHIDGKRENVDASLSVLSA